MKSSSIVPAVVLLVAACTQKPGVRPSPSVTSAASGCTPIVAEALKNPNLDVEQVPTPVSMVPAPLKNVPRTALRKDGSASVAITVLVDTLGRADMSTFTATASHPWLANNLKTVVAKWTFVPAMKGGCKVPRNYHFSANTAPRPKRR